MNSAPAILVYDRDPLFLDALRNFLFTAGFSYVDSTSTVRKTLAQLHRAHYGYVMIELRQQTPCERRWAAVIQGGQPKAKIIFLIKAADQPFMQTSVFEYVIKEDVYSSLMDTMLPQRPPDHREKKAGARGRRRHDEGGPSS